jgi:hypothetical protein
MRESTNKTKLNKHNIERLIHKFSLCSRKKHSLESLIKYMIKITIRGNPKMAVSDALPAFDAMEDKSVNRKDKAIEPSNITTKNNGKFLIGVPKTTANNVTLRILMTSMSNTLYINLDVMISTGEINE